MILNLTPHPVRIYDGARADGIDDLEPHLREVIPPQDKPARLETAELATCGFIEVVAYGQVKNLPAERTGCRYIVSLAVALGIAEERSDLLVPYREVRNASGTVIGCRQLAQPVRESRST